MMNHNCPDCGRTKLVDEKFDCCFPEITVSETGLDGNTKFIACFEGCEDECEFGWGLTEEAAKADLIENYGDDMTRAELEELQNENQ